MSVTLEQLRRVCAALKANAKPTQYYITEELYAELAARGESMYGLERLPPPSWAKLSRPTATTEGVRKVLDGIGGA